MSSISVLMSVYEKDNHEFFNQALKSIWDNQSYKPNEIVLVLDGPLSLELNDMVFYWKSKLGDKLKIIQNINNLGLTKSLNKAIPFCKGDFIARMDSDDLSVSNRFEIQSNFLKNNKEIDLVGSYMQEFSIDGDFSFFRKYPLTHYKIKSGIFKASPMCHASVMFKRKIFDEGNLYNESYITSQDIDLWFNLLSKKYIFANVSSVLYKVRITSDFSNRRSYKKAFNEFNIYWNGILKLFGFSPKLIYPIFRLLFRLMPKFIVNLMYRLNLRNNILN